MDEVIHNQVDIYIKATIGKHGELSNSIFFLIHDRVRDEVLELFNDKRAIQLEDDPFVLKELEVGHQKTLYRVNIPKTYKFKSVLKSIQGLLEFQNKYTIIAE